MPQYATGFGQAIIMQRERRTKRAEWKQVGEEEGWFQGGKLVGEEGDEDRELDSSGDEGVLGGGGRSSDDDDDDDDESSDEDDEDENDEGGNTAMSDDEQSDRNDEKGKSRNDSDSEDESKNGDSDEHMDGSDGTSSSDNEGGSNQDDDDTPKRVSIPPRSNARRVTAARLSGSTSGADTQVAKRVKCDSVTMPVHTLPPSQARKRSQSTGANATFSDRPLRRAGRRKPNGSAVGCTSTASATSTNDTAHAVSSVCPPSKHPSTSSAASSSSSLSSNPSNSQSKRNASRKLSCAMSGIGILRCEVSLGKVKPRSITELEASEYEAAAKAAAHQRKEMGKKNTSWEQSSWTYRGDIKANRRHGVGQTTYDNGEQYVGEYRSDVCDGMGAWYGSALDGTPMTYTGEWHENEQHGYGEMEYVRHGIGLVMRKATFEHGLAQGEGEERFKDSGQLLFKGSFDKGEFREGRLYEPESNLETTSLKWFEGTFIDNKYSGVGCLSYLDGNYFYGYFVNCLRDGIGVMILPHLFDALTVEEAKQRAPTAILPAIFERDETYARWMTVEEYDRYKQSKSGRDERKADADAPRNARVGSAQAKAGEDELIVWNHVRWLIEEAIKKVVKVRSEEQPHFSPPLPPSSLITASLSCFPSPSSFRLLNVRNNVWCCSRDRLCSFAVVNALGCAEDVYLCHTCSERHGKRMEICKSCAESTKCHSGHTLTAMPACHSFCCDCGAKHQRERMRMEMEINDSNGMGMGMSMGKDMGTAIMDESEQQQQPHALNNAAHQDDTKDAGDSSDNNDAAMSDASSSSSSSSSSLRPFICYGMFHPPLHPFELRRLPMKCVKQARQCMSLSLAGSRPDLEAGSSGGK